LGFENVMENYSSPSAPKKKDNAETRSALRGTEIRGGSKARRD